MPDSHLRKTHRFLGGKFGSYTVALDDTLGALPIDLALLCHLTTGHVHVLGEGSEAPVARHVHELATRELGLGLQPSQSELARAKVLLKTQGNDLPTLSE